MQIEVTGRKIELTDSIKQHAHSAFHKLNDHYSANLATLVFEKDRHLFRAHTEYRDDHGHVYNATAENSDLYHAIDLACEKLRSQLNSNKVLH